MNDIYREVDTLQGHALFGSGTCVDLIKLMVPGLAGISTQLWKTGDNIVEAHKAGKTFPRGTAIATFDNGHYPQACPTGYAGSCHHAALLLSVANGGMWIMDQYNTDKRRLFVAKRFIRIPPPSERALPNGKWKDAGNNALAFHVITK